METETPLAERELAELRARPSAIGEWWSIDEARPDHCQIVGVHGGVAQYRDGAFYTGMEDPRWTRKIEWPVTHWCLLVPPMPCAARPSDESQARVKALQTERDALRAAMDAWIRFATHCNERNIVIPLWAAALNEEAVRLTDAAIKEANGIPKD